MANTPVIKGNNTVLWGTGGLYGTGEIVESGSTRLTGDKLEIEDNDGFVVTAIFFNDKHECSFSMVVKTTVPTLKRGDAITIGGVADALVDDMETVWERRDVRKVRVNATKYSGLTVAGGGS